MQIGPNKLLRFLPGSTPAAQAGKQETNAPQSASGSAAALGEATPAQEEAGVILAIQSDAPGAAAASRPSDLVYSNRRKNPAAETDTRNDTERMAAQHQQALERTAGTSSSLSVDKDGVLVAEPASPAEIKVQQFMHFAVSAMRDYADAQDRLKSAAARQEDSAAFAASLLPRSLAEVHKLAARFKLFA